MLAFLLVFLCFNSQNCKTKKSIEKSTQTSDSSTLQRVSVRDSVLKIDSGKSFLLNQIMSLNRSGELDIGKISYTEYNTPKSAATLRFSVDSLRTRGDTLTTTAQDGTAINIYADKFTGELVASVQTKSGKARKIEVDNIHIRTAEQINASNTQSQTQNATSLTRVKDSSGTDSSRLKAKSKTLEKNVDRKLPGLALGLFVCVFAAIVITAIFYIYLRHEDIWAWIKKILKI